MKGYRIDVSNNGARIAIHTLCVHVWGIDLEMSSIDMQPVRPPGHHSTRKQQTNEFRLECTPIAHRELPLPPPLPFEMHKVKMKWAALFRWDFASGNRSVKDIKNSSLLLPPLCVTSTGSERAKLDATRDRGGGFVIWPKSFPLLVDG